MKSTTRPWHTDSSALLDTITLVHYLQTMRLLSTVLVEDTILTLFKGSYPSTERGFETKKKTNPQSFIKF